MRQVLCILMALGLASCANQTCVLVSSTTGIGLDIDYNPQTQMPHAKLGYIRNELVLAPTNRAAKGYPETGREEGAPDVPNIIVEFNFANFFTFWGDSGIYQRIAIGDEAVTQPGAAVMFAKDPAGKLDDKAVEAITALSGVKSVGPRISARKLKIVTLGKDPVVRELILVRLSEYGVNSWDNFIDGKPRELTEDEMDKIINGVK